jgi:BASS family bile acid:Na+ symporter
MTSNITTPNTTTTTTTTCSQFSDDWNSIIQVICLAGLLFSMSLVIEFDEFKDYFRTPKPLLIGILSQFIIMPAICFGLAHVNPNMDVAYKLGLIALGCSPGGSLSNMVCMVAGADLKLSIAMTTASHFVAIVMLPLNLYLYVKVSGLANDICLSVGGIAVSAFVIAAGTGIGLWISPKLSLLGLKLGSLFGVFCGTLIVALGFIESSASKYPVWSTPGDVVGLSIIPSILGIFFGVTIASICQLRKPQRVTVAVETGVQNKFIAIASVSSLFVAGDDRNKALSVVIIYATFSGIVAYSFAIFFWKVFGWSDLPRDANLCFACKKVVQDIHDKKRGGNATTNNKKTGLADKGVGIIDDVEAVVAVIGGDSRLVSVNNQYEHHNNNTTITAFSSSSSSGGGG